MLSRFQYNLRNILLSYAAQELNKLHFFPCLVNIWIKSGWEPACTYPTCHFTCIFTLQYFILPTQSHFVYQAKCYLALKIRFKFLTLFPPPYPSLLSPSKMMSYFKYFVFIFEFFIKLKFCQGGRVYNSFVGPATKKLLAGTEI